MKAVRKFVGVVAALAVLALAGCQSAPNNAPQAANSVSDNSGSKPGGAVRAGAGALIGALVGHGKGAAIGAGIGAGGGTATAYAIGKKDIYLPAETRLRFVLREPVTVSEGS